MFREEQKKNYEEIFDCSSRIDIEFINIKIAIHNLDKLGVKTENLEKLLENVGIEFYKFKDELNKEIRTKF